MGLFRPVRFRWHLSTPLDETKQRLLVVPSNLAVTGDWSRWPARVRFLEWNQGRGGEYPTEVMRIRFEPSGEGSLIDVRSRFWNWRVAGFFAWMIPFILLLVSMNDLDRFGWPLLALTLVFSLFPLYVYLRERREAADRIESLARLLEPLRCAPPAPVVIVPPVGPYR